MKQKRITKPAKRILYLLHKYGNRYLSDLSFGEGKDGQDKTKKILYRLVEKRLVTSKQVLLHKNNKHSARAYYWLTDDGKKIADEIVKEIDENCSYYKGW